MVYFLVGVVCLLYKMRFVNEILKLILFVFDVIMFFIFIGCGLSKYVFKFLLWEFLWLVMGL